MKCSSLGPKSPRQQIILLFGSPMCGKSTLGKRLASSPSSKYSYASAGDYWRSHKSCKAPDTVLRTFLQSTLSNVDPEKILILDAPKRGSPDLDVLAEFNVDVLMVVHLEMEKDHLLSLLPQRVASRLSQEERLTSQEEERQRIESFFQRMPELLSCFHDYGVPVKPLLSVWTDDLPPRIGITVLSFREVAYLKQRLCLLLGVREAQFSMPSSFLFGADALSWVAYPGRYRWTWKADGQRVFLFKLEEGIFALNRRGAVWRCDDLQPFFASTQSLVFDTEWIDGSWLVFDILLVNGERCWGLPLADRLAYWPGFSQKDCPVVLKDFRPVEEIGCFEQAPSFPTDGLIFSPTWMWYTWGFDDFTFKWKDLHLMTADLELGGTGLWECSFDPLKRCWIPMRRRFDKGTANSPELVAELERMIMSGDTFATMESLLTAFQKHHHHQERGAFVPPLAVHPFRELEPIDLQRVLTELESTGEVEIWRGGDFQVVSYTAGADQKSSLLVRASRGCVVDSQWRLLCCSVPRFFPATDECVLPQRMCCASLKLDGSMITFFRLENDVYTASKRRMDSEQAHWARAYLRSLNIVHLLREGWSYAAEAMYQENLVDVPHVLNTLVLWGVWDGKGHQLTPEQMATVARELCLLSAPFAYGSLNEFVSFIERCGGNHRGVRTMRVEGLVVQFEDGSREKLISSLFKRAHQSNICAHPLYIWDAIRGGRNLEVAGTHLGEQVQLLRERMGVQFRQARIDLVSAWLQILGSHGKSGSSVEFFDREYGNKPLVDADAGGDGGGDQRIEESLEKVLALLSDSFRELSDRAGVWKFLHALRRHWALVVASEKELFLARVLVRCCYEPKFDRVAVRLACALILGLFSPLDLKHIFERFAAETGAPTTPAVKEEVDRVTSAAFLCGFLPDSSMAIKSLSPALRHRNFSKAAYCVLLAMETLFLNDQVLNNLSTVQSEYTKDVFDVWAVGLRCSLRMALLDAIRPEPPYCDGFEDIILPSVRQTFAKGWPALVGIPQQSISPRRDIWLRIWQCCDAETLASCRLVCRIWWLWILDFDVTTRWSTKSAVAAKEVARLKKEREEAEEERKYGRRGRRYSGGSDYDY